MQQIQNSRQDADSVQLHADLRLRQIVSFSFINISAASGSHNGKGKTFEDTNVAKTEIKNTSSGELWDVINSLTVVGVIGESVLP